MQRNARTALFALLALVRASHFFVHVRIRTHVCCIVSHIRDERVRLSHVFVLRRTGIESKPAATNIDAHASSNGFFSSFSFLSIFFLYVSLSCVHVVVTAFEATEVDESHPGKAAPILDVKRDPPRRFLPIVDCVIAMR